jgi:hypothetical protein
LQTNSSVFVNAVYMKITRLHSQQTKNARRIVRQGRSTMLHKTLLALTAAATLGAATLPATEASAWGWHRWHYSWHGHYGWHRHYAWHRHYGWHHHWRRG